LELDAEFDVVAGDLDAGVLDFDIRVGHALWSPW
jgi:hypothetical protein